VYDQATSAVTLRGHAQVAELFGGWDLAGPGLVQVPLWRTRLASRPGRRNWPGPGSTAASPARAGENRRVIPIAAIPRQRLASHLGGTRRIRPEPGAFARDVVARALPPQRRGRPVRYTEADAILDCPSRPDA
jgi:hypothetical protein